MQVRKLTQEQSQKMQQAKVERQKEEQAREQKREEERTQAEVKNARLIQLVTATDALYEEMDKLNKKAPAMEISELTLQRVNKVIKSIKEFVESEKDDFVDELQEFIPAGNMPEYRDVVLVLGQLRAGLIRFESSHVQQWRNLGVR